MNDLPTVVVGVTTGMVLFSTLIVVAGAMVWVTIPIQNLYSINVKDVYMIFEIAANKWNKRNYKMTFLAIWNNNFF